MNEVLVNNWNSVVSDNDTVYVLGDLFMGKISDMRPIFDRLKGHIVLVRGNHDTENRINFYKENNIEVKDFFVLNYKGVDFVMCHYPMDNQEFLDMVTNKNPNTVLLYGHVHSMAPQGLNNHCFHVGVDTNNLTPVLLDKIWNQYKKEG